MSFKRAFHLMLLGLMVAMLLAACGDSTATTGTTTTAASSATTAAVAATTAAPATTAAVAATTAATATTAAATATTAAPATTAAVTATTAAPATTAAATATTAAATTTTAAASGGSADIVENVKFDGTSGKKGGQFVYAYSGQFPTSVNPYYVGDNVAIEIVNITYGFLIGQSNNNKYYAYLLSQVPTLENGGVKVSSDGKTMDVNLKLKPGVKWSDGSAMTSKDLAYTWKWVTDADNAGVQQDLSAWQLITGVDTPDDSTAVLHFSQVYGPYLNFLNGYYPMPQAVWSKIPVKDAEKSPESDVPTVTSGPFKVTEFTADDRVTLSRNDNFTPVWGFNAYLDKVIFRNTPDANSALASVSKGDLDSAENLDDNQGAAAAKVPNAVYDIAQQYSWEYLQLNLTNPIFQDKAVRQALDMALDKQALIKQFRTPKTAQTAVDVSPLSPFFDKSLSISKYDAAAANKLLDDAGWKLGADGVRAKGSQKLSFVLSSTTAPVRKSTAEVMLTYWKAIGADVKFQPYKSSEFFASYTKDGILAKGKFDIGMFAQVGGIDPDGSFNNYASVAIPTDANKGNGSNYGRINDPIIDKALADQRATVDQGKRKDAWVAFQKSLHDNLWELPLYTRVNNYVVSSKVKNYKPNATTDGNLWNVVELYVP